ncbi:MAG: hypothetical protein ACXWU5_09930, partial [Rhodoplanes sp.]
MTEHEPVNDEEAWEQMAEMCREELPDGTDVRNVLAAFRLLVEEMRTEQLTERDDEVDRSSA